MDEEFGEEFDEFDQKENKQEEGEVVRVRLPKKNEVIGIVDQLLGLRKMYVRCLDGVVRLCRVPGRLRRSMWVRQGDVVIVEPWDYDKDKGDIVYTYRKSQVEWLRRKGFLKDLEEF